MSVASFRLVIRNRSVVNKSSYEVTKSCVVIIPLYLGIEHSEPYDFVIDTCYQLIYLYIYIYIYIQLQTEPFRPIGPHHAMLTSRMEKPTLYGQLKCSTLMVHLSHTIYLSIYIYIYIYVCVCAYIYIYMYVLVINKIINHDG